MELSRRRFGLLGAAGAAAACQATPGRLQSGDARPLVLRLADGPILTCASHASIGRNLAEPSLVRAPPWIERPLGRYYLYFADHAGKYIRLAYADAVTGPWRIHPPGTLRIEQTPFPTRFGYSHIASPDVHVDAERQRVVMYYHGLENEPNDQVTRVATSTDGLNFSARTEILGLTYWRAFTLKQMTYAMAMPGQFYRSADPLRGFEAGPRLFNDNMRHAGLLLRGDTLHVFWTQVGDAPERIYLSTIDVSGPWEGWKESAPVELLRPERAWEGANMPAVPSVRGAINEPVNQLRDPAIYEEGGRVFMIYAVAGESGLALAEVFV